MFGRADGNADLGGGRAAGFLPAEGRSRAGLQQEPGQTLQKSSSTAQGAEAKVFLPFLLFISSISVGLID